MSGDGLWQDLYAAPSPEILLDALPPPPQLSHLVSADEKTDEGHGHVAARQEAETAHAPEAGVHHREPDAAHEVRIRRGPRPEQGACLDPPFPLGNIRCLRMVDRSAGDFEVVGLSPSNI